VTVGSVIVRHLGRAGYEPTLAAMKAFTDARTPSTPDELWVVEHDPVFTLGLAADRSHVLDAHGLPVIQTDRGGEVTYHAPGQVVVYLLMDLRRRQEQNRLFVREFVHGIEQAVIDALTMHGLATERKHGAPGIYMSQQDVYGAFQGAKIAALGLKVRSNGCTYHGLALNVDMDLEPFTWINPCGYPGLKTVDMKSMGVSVALPEAQSALVRSLLTQLNIGNPDPV